MARRREKRLFRQLHMLYHASIPTTSFSNPLPVTLVPVIRHE